MRGESSNSWSVHVMEATFTVFAASMLTIMLCGRTWREAHSQKLFIEPKKVNFFSVK